MLATVDFDHEPLLAAHEIDNEMLNCFLPNKFEPVKPTVTQFKPKRHLSVG